ncbi:MAG: hypothetical protein OEV28_08505 [Nitrospirota bacterium]|nr:hypothetical protein [Nitrospirota bacterium]
MNSLTTDLDKLVALIANNSALQAFCKAKWRNPLTVKKTYKRREELHLSQLPIIMITRPSVKKSFLTGARDGTHTLMLYCGFPQENPNKIQNEFVEFEEKIDDALLSVHPESIGFKSIAPVSSVNDEGKYKPACFIVMEVEVQHRRM